MTTTAITTSTIFGAAFALLAAAAVLPAAAAELSTSPAVSAPSIARSGGGYPFMGWRPSFEYTRGGPSYGHEPDFVGPAPACGVISEPVKQRNGEILYRHVYRCW